MAVICEIWEGWPEDAMVLEVQLIWIRVGQGPTVLVEGFFSRLFLFLRLPGKWSDIN